MDDIDFVVGEAYEATPNDETSGLLVPYRVLWVDLDSDALIAIAIEASLRQPAEWRLKDMRHLLREGHLQKTDVDSRPFDLDPEDSIPQEYLDVRDRAWRIIEPLVDEPNIPQIYFRATRRILVARRAEELHLHPKQIHRPLYRYWAGKAGIDSLIPHYDHCGPQGSPEERKQKPGQKKRGPIPYRVTVNNDDGLRGIAVIDVRQKIVDGITEFYKSGETRRDAFKETKKKYFNKGYIKHGTELVPIEPEDHETISYRQFCTVIDELNYDLKLSKRLVDASTWNLKNRAVLGSSRRKLFGPCARFEIDATIVDIYLVSIFNPAWIIGRPVLYVVMDVFSGMVVGFYLGLEGPSWEGARLALFNAFIDKVGFCRRYGVEITPDLWPCHHLPHKLVGDRAELISIASDTLPKWFGIIAKNTPANRADWKPTVEQQFRLTNVGCIHHQPGAVVARLAEVQKRDYRLDACLTIPQLTSILIRKFIKHNTSAYRPDRLPEEMLGENLLDAAPINIWDWGMKNLTGEGKIVSRQKVWTNLLPEGIATIRRDGIYFKGRHYTCERAVREEWFAATTLSKTHRAPTFEIRHNPALPDHIYIRNCEAKDWEQGHLLDKDERFRHARIEEVVERTILLTESDRQHQSNVRTSNAILDAECERIVEDAKAEVDALGERSKAAITKDISKHRAFEKTAERAQRAMEEAASYGPKHQEQISGSVIPFRQKPEQPDPLDDLWKP